jgi:hypothetical protein
MLVIRCGRRRVPENTIAALLLSRCAALLKLNSLFHRSEIPNEIRPTKDTDRYAQMLTEVPQRSDITLAAQ